MIACPHCRIPMTPDPSLAGQDVLCSHCRGQFKMPGSLAPPPLPPPLTPMAFCRSCGSRASATAMACLQCGIPPLAGRNFCPTCGEATNPAAIICVKCGSGFQGRAGVQGDLIHPSQSPVDPILAAVASFFLPGLGQLLCGQTAKGAVMLIGSVFLLFTIIGAVVVWAMAIADAYAIAAKLKAGKSVRQWEFF